MSVFWGFLFYFIAGEEVEVEVGCVLEFAHVGEQLGAVFFEVKSNKKTRGRHDGLPQIELSCLRI